MIFSTIGKDVPVVSPIITSRRSIDSNVEEKQSDKERKALISNADGAPFRLTLSVNVNEMKQDSDVEMNAMLMTKQVLDKEVEREKLFSNVMLSQRDFKQLHENASGSSNKGGRKRPKKSNKNNSPSSTGDDSSNAADFAVATSQGSANAAFAKFRLENPNLTGDELLQSYGELSLGQSNSLIPNIDDNVSGGCRIEEGTTTTLLFFCFIFFFLLSLSDDHRYLTQARCFANDYLLAFEVHTRREPQQFEHERSLA